MKILLIKSIVLLFLSANITYGQSNHIGYDLHRVDYNHNKEKVYFIPYEFSCYGTVQTQSGKLLLADSLYWLDQDCNKPEIEINSIVILMGKDDTTMVDDLIDYNYHLYAFDTLGNFLVHIFPGPDLIDYWVEGTIRYIYNGKMGVIDSNGTILIEAQKYTYIEMLEDNQFLACKNCDAVDWGDDELQHGINKDDPEIYDIYDKGGSLKKENAQLVD